MLAIAFMCVFTLSAAGKLPVQQSHVIGDGVADAGFYQLLGAVIYKLGIQQKNAGGSAGKAFGLAVITL